jgi:hypothetical protein
MVEELLEEEKGVGWVIAIMGHGHIPDGWTFGIVACCLCLDDSRRPPTNERKMIAVLESIPGLLLFFLLLRQSAPPGTPSLY